MSQSDLVSRLRRNNLLTTAPAIDAMTAVDRRWFANGKTEGLYNDKPLQLFQQSGYKVSLTAPFMQAVVLDNLAHHLPKHRFHRCLDLGCATGYIARCFLHMGNEHISVTGVDLFPKSIALARDAMLHSGVLPSQLEGSMQLLAEDAIQYIGRSDLKTSFSFIHVGFCISEAQLGLLEGLLHRDGVAIAPVGEKGTEQELIMASKGTNGKVVRNKIMQCVYSPAASVVQAAVAAAPGDDRQELTRMLKDWRKHFEKEFGRKPNLDDMNRDAECKALLQTIATLGKDT